MAWARSQCLAWEELEDQLPNFLEELPDCPCTLAQAQADSGRFHVSPYPGQGTGDVGGRWGQLSPLHARWHPPRRWGGEVEALGRCGWGPRALRG